MKTNIIKEISDFCETLPNRQISSTDYVESIGNKYVHCYCIFGSTRDYKITIEDFYKFYILKQQDYIQEIPE